MGGTTKARQALSPTRGDFPTCCRWRAGLGGRGQLPGTGGEGLEAPALLVRPPPCLTLCSAVPFPVPTPWLVGTHHHIICLKKHSWK